MCTSSVLVGAEPVLVPHARHELLAGDDAAGVARQLGEEIELLARERELAPVHLRPARGEVDHEVAEDDRARRRLRRRDPAQDGADARDTSAPLNGLTT